jgi:alpha-L-fucosidase
MFIHWGIYSVLQDGEWVMNNRGMRVAQYETLAPQFNPVRFDAAAWVGLARAAGMKYITITSKHHDGFAMYDSKVSDWDVVDRTPFRRDALAELARECRAQGIRLFFYYSQLDWRHPDFYPRGQTGRTAGRPDSGRFERYLDYMDAQVRELLTGYGPIGGIWFDGEWDRPDADWGFDRTYGMIHRLQPAALLISNHHHLPRPGEDVQTFERDLPGRNTVGFNTMEIGELPLETAQTMNNSWGFRLQDREFRSSASLIRELVNAAGRNGNYLLNVGPRPDGTIQPEFVDTLRAVGRWMERYGGSIYGTRGGPISPRPWGVTTRRGDSVFVHLLDWEDPELSLPSLPHAVRAASLLATGAPVRFRQSAGGVTLSLPPRGAGEVDQVVVLRLAR